VAAAFRKLSLRPGVNVELSATANQFFLATSKMIRFYGGMVQKLGGWVRLTSQVFFGQASGLHGWADIVGNPYLAVGTEQRLEVLAAGMLQDITPVIATDNPAVAFSTSISSTSVTITDAAHNPAVGDWIALLTQVSVGGIVLFGFYKVQTVPSGTTYTVTAASPATANVTNGGAVPSYTTTNTQPTVSVTLNNHGYITGGGGIFSAAVSTTVATVVIAGNFAVTSVTNANVFVITAGSNANASTTASENAGNARIQYLLPSGSIQNTNAGGYGMGPYGGGPYGTGAGATFVPGRQWSLDHFGQDLIASPTNGRIYFWQPPNIAPATEITGTSPPLASTAVFVMSQSEIVVSLGAEIGGTQEPLLIRWSDAGDFTDWVASVSNLAGSFSIPSGSKLVGGIATGLGAIIWTDIGAWSMNFIGFPLVFSVQPLNGAGGLVAMRAAGTVGSMIMWLGAQFFRYDVGGGVQPLECSVWDFYFNNVDLAQPQLIHCAVNINFNEMAWHFPLLISSPLWSANTQFAYVKFNYVENCWDYGVSRQYQRSASAPKSPAGNMIGADLGGLLQQHEQGYDADGASMMWSWQTGYFDLADGAQMVFSDMLIPDFVTIGSPSYVPNILTQDWPNGTVTTVVTKQMSSTTTFLPYSARGRQMSIGFAASSADMHTFSRIGAIRVRVAPDGEF
jgi:hypothetical protein